MSLNQTLDSITNAFEPTGQKMPVLFVGHGSPMNAIEDNEFSRAWSEAGKNLPRPKAILCVSAHWETIGTQVTAMDRPRTIHDFGGFPRPLYEAQYPAPGSPDLARITQETIQRIPVKLDTSWGLDHGTWSILLRMFPQADIPVIQLSLDQSQPPEFHYGLGKQLSALRERGVLILGSGNIVHNLGRVVWDEGKRHDWAVEFDETAKRLIESGDHASMVHYEKLGSAAQLSIPTNEHYLPLLYILSLQQANEPIQFFADRITFASLSMRSLRIG